MLATIRCSQTQLAMLLACARYPTTTPAMLWDFLFNVLPLYAFVFSMARYDDATMSIGILIFSTPAQSATHAMMPMKP